MKKIKEQKWIKYSWQFLILAALIISLGFHAITLAVSYMAPPSEGFSREIKVGEVSYGFSKYNRNQMATALSINKENIAIFAVDGPQSKLFIVDAQGDIQTQWDIPLDLSQMSNIKVNYIDESHLGILYGTFTLYATVIDIRTGEFADIDTLATMKSFDSSGFIVVNSKEDGLYGINMEQPEQGEQFIVGGDFSSYSFYEKDDLIYLTCVEMIETNFVTGKLFVINPRFEIISEHQLFPRTDKHLIGEIKDVYCKEDILTNIFVWGDSKSNKSLLTTLQVNSNTGELINQFSKSFNLNAEKIHIAKATDGEVSLIMQGQVLNGINIVYNTLQEEKDTVSIPLTKTRGVSALPAYYEIDTSKILVFSDLNKSARAIYFASNDPELFEKTTSFETINIWLVIGTSIFIFVVALFAAMIFIFIFEPIPCLVLAILYKVTQAHKHKFKVQMWITAAIHTVIKLIVVAKLIASKPELYVTHSQIIGGEPNVYIMLILSSLFSMVCAHRFAKQRNDYDSVVSYGFFAIIDISLFGFTVLSYFLTTLLIFKL